MDKEYNYEDETITRVLMERGHAVGGLEEEVEEESFSSSEEGGECPPVPVMVPADRVSTHDLPLAAPLAVVERKLFHIIIICLLLSLYPHGYNYNNLFVVIIRL